MGPCTGDGTSILSQQGRRTSTADVSPLYHLYVCIQEEMYSVKYTYTLCTDFSLCLQVARLSCLKCYTTEKQELTPYFYVL